MELFKEKKQTFIFILFDRLDFQRNTEGSILRQVFLSKSDRRRRNALRAHCQRRVRPKHCSLDHSSRDQ